MAPSRRRDPLDSPCHPHPGPHAAPPCRRICVLARRDPAGRNSCFLQPSWLRYLPLILVPAVCLLAVAVTADPIPPNGVNVDQSAHNLHGLMMNCCAFFSHWVLVVPFGVPWILLRWREMSFKLTVTAALIAALIATRAGWIAFVAGAGALVLADVALTAIRSRDRDQLALFLWLLPAIAPVFYIHLPCKYLVPLVPAAAILLTRQLDAATTARRFLLPAAVGSGIVLRY